MPDAVQLDHVAFGVPEISGVVPLVVAQLGGRERGSGPGGGFQFWQWEFAGGGALEILEPHGPPGGFMHRFLASRGGPGPHHLTFKLPDIHDAMNRAKTMDYDVVGFDDSSPSWIEAFLHPKQAQGIVVQLVESNPELQDDEGSWVEPDYPPSPSDRPEPVTLVGLRLAARSGGRARRQWQELLLGECSAQERGLLFHWKDSPLRVAVEIDPALAEGPIALEVASERRLELPEGPHPVLGLPIVQVEA